MKRVICTICLMIVLSIIGCGGRRPQIVVANQRNDRFLSCEAMAREMVQNEVLITEKLKRDRSKLLSNIFWLIWFPPLMDVKEAEKSEAEALQRRNNRLETLMLDKDCDLGNIKAEILKIRLERQVVTRSSEEKRKARQRSRSHFRGW